MKPTRQVTLAISEADAALTIIKNVISERLHEDDRKDIDKLIEKARRALDGANSHLSDVRHDAESALDRL